VCTDEAGNPNAALATAFSRLYTARPTVAISSTTAATTNANPIPITITFNKAVENFVDTDVTLTNCTISSFATVDNIVWTANLTPTGQGLVEATIPEGVCNQQGSGTVTNVASPTFSRTFNSVAPGAALSSAEPDPTNSSIQITITFNEQVASGTFTAGDITVSGGGSAGNLQTSDNIVFTADVTPGGEGSATQNRTNADPIPIPITFDKSVTGFDASDITVSDGTDGTVSEGPSVYTCDITPTAPGLVTVDIAAGACLDQDGAADPNTAATQFTRTRITTLGYDKTNFAAAATTTPASFTVAANSNRVLIVSVYVRSADPTAPSIDGVTYGTTAMTEVTGSIISFTNGSNRSGRVKLYYLKDPTAGSALNVTATFNAAHAAVHIGVVSLYDAYVHGVDPIGAVATANGGATNTVTTNITTITNYSWLVDMMASDRGSGTWTPGSSQTEQWGQTAGSGFSAGSTKPVTTAGATSMSWGLGTAQLLLAFLDSVAEIKIAQ
jgi:hypothetical protein